MLPSSLFSPLFLLILVTPSIAKKKYTDPETAKCRGEHYHGETRCWNDATIQYCEKGRWSKKTTITCPKDSVCRRPKPNECTWTLFFLYRVGSGGGTGANMSCRRPLPAREVCASFVAAPEVSA
jgi:hypothetical protein